MRNEQLQVIRDAVVIDDFITGVQVSEATNGLLLTTQVGLVEFMLSDARLIAIFKKEHCSEHWARLAAYAPLGGPDSDEVSRSVFDASDQVSLRLEEAVRIDLASGLFNIRQLNVLKRKAQELHWATHQMVASCLDAEQLTEGKPIAIISKRYERSPAVRAKAIALHGLSCCVCDFNFESSYGNIGGGFIHIHHIERVADAGERAVNIATDVVPVCPNCHAMLHRQTPPLQPSDLRDILNMRCDK